MSDLESRLRRAGHEHPTDTIAPDLSAITDRGAARRRNKRIGTGVGVAAIAAVGAIGIGNRLGPPTRIEAATDGISSEATEPVAESEDQARPDAEGAVALSTRLEEAGYDGQICFSYDDADTGAGTLTFTVDSDSGQIIVNETRDLAGTTDLGNVFAYGTLADDTGTRLDATGINFGEGDAEPSYFYRTYLIEPDLGGARGEEYNYPTVGCPEVEPLPQPTESETEAEGMVDDGLGGSLAIVDDQLVHRRADGEFTTIVFPAVEAVTVQHFVTDIAPINGEPYLFLERFVDAGAAGTEVNFEVSILAVNLVTDEVVVVEQRPITSVASPDWTYNGHITTDGTNIIVMRELWQSYCLYAEGLTLDGQPVDVVQAAEFPKPEGLDTLTEADIEKVQFVDPAEGGLSPCLTLDDIPDGGVAVLGRHADDNQFAAFMAAFNQSALGFSG